MPIQCSIGHDWDLGQPDSGEHADLGVVRLASNLYLGYPIPPSTRISVLVMYDASSDARNATTAAISSGVPIEEAEDLVQETYLRAWRSFDGFEGRRPSVTRVGPR